MTLDAPEDETHRPERRRAPRFSLAIGAAVATRTEQCVTGGQTVNASLAGVLLAFAGPAIPLGPGDRCLVSLRLPDGVLHALGVVRRRDIGDDHRHYVGIELDELAEWELDRLRAIQDEPSPN